MSRGRQTLVFLTALLVSVPAAHAADFVWIEGEKPDSANVKFNAGGWGNKHFLSGESWLHLSIDADKVAREVPAEGIFLGYDFTLAKEAKYEIWNRIGFEFVRSPFAWRIDAGDWKTVSPEELTTDLMEIAFFAEVAWLKLGDAALKAGPHKIEIKIPRIAKGDKFERVLYASDAICIHAEKFHPNGKYKPGEEFHDATDAEAAKKIFELPEPAERGARSTVKLNGEWEVCRHDEQLPGEVAQPIRDFPEEPHWKAIAVPGDKNSLRPDLLFAHRLWYRTRVNVGPRAANGSFFLTFPQNNLNTTVFVNGVYCGFNKNPFARFSIDVTKGVKAGVNEVWVGVKDAWYGYSANPRDPLKLRKKFNLPLKFSHDGFQDLAYPIWNNFQSGILVAPEFVAAGRLYASDVFCQPLVSRKELTVEATFLLRGEPGNIAVGALVEFDVVNAKTGKVEKVLKSRRLDIKSGEEKTLRFTEPWDNPKLWWPDEPNLYRLRIRPTMAGTPLDVSETTFGFREWTTDGKDFKLNGVPWHGWADTHTHSTKEDWLAFYHKSNQKFMRFWGTKWLDLPPDEALDYFDKAGVVVRRSGMLDGEAIGYMAIENDPDLKKDSPLKMDLMRNWRDQVVAQVKGERNHPSVMLWSIENEFLYINCINLYGGLMDQFEAEVVKTSDAVRAVDPTRPTMTDGGGATKSNAMPVHGDHYTTGDYWRYPDLAYDPNVTGGGRGRWVWDQKRPRFIGEEMFAQGHNPDFAYFGGEEVFVGQVRSRPAVGLFVRMLTEGYRWSGNGAVHFWQMQDAASGQYEANAPRAVFCRQWDWTFGSGQAVKRTFGIFNDTRFDDPITFTYTLRLNGLPRPLVVSREYRIPAGQSEKFDVLLEMPRTSKREEGELTLTLSVKGEEVYKDVKAVSVLAPTPAVAGPLTKLSEKELLVFDPHGEAAAFLKARQVPFTSLTRLADLPKTGKVLLIGKDALDATQSTTSTLAAFASSGRSVVVLEQQHPLKYQGVPADLEASSNEGRTAFGEDLNHPTLHGLQQKDFFTWGGNEIVYRNAYGKPTRGGKSLVQCHTRLQNSALVEVPAGNGLLLLCQLVVGEKLASNAVAQQLLFNLLDYGAGYKLEYRPVVAAIDGDPQLARVLEAIGLKHTRAAGPLQALEPGARIAIVSATPANLEVLAQNLDRVKAFNAAGGYLVLHQLTPDGLKDYNKIVGFDHMIRPFALERVTFPPRRHPLTAGLATGDIVLYSSKQIFPWQAGNYVAKDVFSYVVDFEDVAPFAKFENDFNRNMVNGFVSADGWVFIVNVPAPDKPPLDFSLKLPKEQEIIEMEYVGNTFYYPATRIELIADGNNKVSFAVKPNNESQTFPIQPTLKGKDLVLRLADWDKIPGKNNVTGLDHLALKAKRPPDFYDKVRPMLNIGAMMEYPRGAGGIVLCNLLFQDAEEVPINKIKKQTMFAAILRNLKAEFSGGKSVIAGANLNYQPLDLSKQANQYRDAKGWFGDKMFTFKDLPTGKQTFAGVPYMIYDFPTSPVPTVIMLGGPGVPNKLPDAVKGIPVNRKADALFFLQAARLDVHRNDQEIKEKKQYELCRYIVTYEDGKTAEAPIYAEIDVEDYRQKTPTALPGAQIAWTQVYEGAGLSGVAYAKQWDNPRPDVVIKSIDMVYGPQRRGVPALLAVTAATAEK
jgi:Glycosyl hydrolases family 2/Glycosyl hydrolases family 2, TIM barrel domain